MTMKSSGLLTVSLLSFAYACRDSQPTSPVVPASAAALARSSSCADSPTTVVATEAALHDALAAAQSGDVIAIDGSIAMHSSAVVGHGVTLTCASPASGLHFAGGQIGEELIEAHGDSSVIRGLTLDATNATFGSAFYSDGSVGHRTEGNVVTCGMDVCGFWVNTVDAVITDNILIGSVDGFARSGIHAQLGQGTIIEGNTLNATASVGVGPWGAIRPVASTGIRVRRNSISGPWSNGISATNIQDSEIALNTIDGVRFHGIVMNVLGGPPGATARNVTLLANRVRNAGTVSYFLRNACDNALMGNASFGSAPVALLLDASTGANVVAGTPGAVDNGARDCDNDGQPDPNIIRGR